jgi:hypothetical protein
MSLRFGDLKDLVLPLIGVDKFQPKTGTEAEVIVISFHIKEETAAKDLEKFLEMSAVDTLDTEAAPNPDEDGHYVVFVEFKRDENFWANLQLLLRDIENVSEEISWSVDPFKSDNLYKLNDPELLQIIITDKAEYEFRIQPEEEIEDPEYTDTLESINKAHNIQFKAYVGEHKFMTSRYKLNEQAINSITSYEQRVLNSYIGDTYSINDVYIKENSDTLTVFRRV